MGLRPLSDHICQICQISKDNGFSWENFQLEELSSSVFIAQSDAAGVDLGFVNEDWSLLELLKACKEVIKVQTLDNVLLSDNYKYGNIHTDPVYTFMTTSKWDALRSLLGNMEFANLLLNYTGFYHEKGNSLQLFGKRLLPKFEGKLVSRPVFSLQKALYRDNYHNRKLNLIPLSKTAFLKEIFSFEYSNLSNSKRSVKKLAPISKIIAQIITNHNKIKYHQIFENICPERPKVTDNLDFAIGKKVVLRFVIVIFELLFPKSLYGSSHNKSVIFSKFGELITNDKDYLLDLQTCLNGIRLKDITWLGKRCDGNLNKQDFIKRKILLEQFIKWLFQEFLNKLLSLHFHITHISSSKELIFFKHHRWKSITAPFVKSYISEHLIKEDSVSISQTESSDKIQSNFKVMPKKNNDFRVINKPMKGSLQKDVLEYTKMVQQDIRPTKRILNQLRLSRFSGFRKITSIDQIPLNIMRFKMELLSRNSGSLPVLHFLKFDVKACYDTIPKSKVEQSLSELITPETVYNYVSTKTMDLRMASVSQSKALRTTQALTRFPRKKYLMLDVANAKVDSLLGRDILAVTHSQLNNSTTRIKGKQYVRQKGIFQGLHLSSLFCDIVYDKMVDEVFGFLNSDESLILRLADDFLIISSNSEVIGYSATLLNRGLADYGVEVNKLKTVMSLGDSEGEFTYCGYNIDPVELTVLKDFRDSPVSTSLFKSHKALVDKLLSIYKLRLSYNTLDLRLNTMKVVQKQIDSLARNVAKNYRLASKGLIISINGFSKLIDEMITATLPKLNSYLSIDDSSLIADTIVCGFLQELEVKNTKFRVCINLLRERLEG